MDKKTSTKFLENRQKFESILSTTKKALSKHYNLDIKNFETKIIYAKTHDGLVICNSISKVSNKINANYYKKIALTLIEIRGNELHIADFFNENDRIFVESYIRNELMKINSIGEKTNEKE